MNPRLAVERPRGRAAARRKPRVIFVHEAWFLFRLGMKPDSSHGQDWSRTIWRHPPPPRAVKRHGSRGGRSITWGQTKRDQRLPCQTSRKRGGHYSRGPYDKVSPCLPPTRSKDDGQSAACSKRRDTGSSTHLAPLPTPFSVTAAIKPFESDLLLTTQPAQLKIITQCSAQNAKDRTSLCEEMGTLSYYTGLPFDVNPAIFIV